MTDPWTEDLLSKGLHEAFCVVRDQSEEIVGTCNCRLRNPPAPIPPEPKPVERAGESLSRADRGKLQRSTKEYKAWNMMRRRCNRPKFPTYPRYGGRGIKVDPSWDSFAKFLADIGPAPSPNHSVDHIDNNGNYEPGNVRWATIKQQQRNRKVTIMLTANGQTKPLVQWCEEMGISRGTIRGRLESGWSPNDAVNTPIDKKMSSISKRKPRG